MGPYKPLRTWVDEFIPYYMGNVMGVDGPLAALSIFMAALASHITLSKNIAFGMALKFFPPSKALRRGGCVFFFWWENPRVTKVCLYFFLRGSNESNTGTVRYDLRTWQFW